MLFLPPTHVQLNKLTVCKDSGVDAAAHVSHDRRDEIVAHAAAGLAALARHDAVERIGAAMDADLVRECVRGVG